MASTSIGTRRVLVTGGVRSGKSSWAERALADAVGVHYIAPGYPADPASDPEWTARVAAHRVRRPASWVTVETRAVADAVAAHPGPVLLDCLGTWLTRTLDDLGWERTRGELTAEVEARTRALADAVAAHVGPLVVVTNEVGWGLVSEHASGRLFTDLLGRINQTIGDAVDDVVLVVAGRPLVLPRP